MDYIPSTRVADNREMERVEMESKKTVGLMKDLNEKFNNLPDGKPDSKSSDVEDLYARMEESACNLKNQLRVFSHYRKTINELIKKHSRNRGVLNNDRKTLQSIQARRKYSYAEFIAENRYRKVMSCRNELIRVMDYARKALKKADTKKFPGGNPKKKFRAEMPKIPSQAEPGMIPPPVMPQTPLVSSNPHPMTGQVNSLISSGPTGQ